MILALIFLGLFIWLIVTIKGNTDVHRYPGKTKEEIKEIKKKNKVLSPEELQKVARKNLEWREKNKGSNNESSIWDWVLPLFGALLLIMGLIFYIYDLIK